MKNLYYALQVLTNVKIPLIFSIYGTIENKNYWGKCQNIIKKLPENVVISYKGSIPNQIVNETLKNNDIFFLPTMGENFGHVIFEALSAGLFVLVSDQTPWKNLDKAGVGCDINLNDPMKFVKIIEEYAQKTVAEKILIKSKAINYSKSLINKKNIVDEI